jgi:hypothetical protein
MLEQGELAPQTNEAANQPGAKQCWGEPVINRAGFFEQADRASPRLNGSAPKFKGKEGKRKQGLLDARLQLSGDEYKQLPAAHDFNNSFIDDATESQFVGRVNELGHNNHADLQRELLCGPQMRGVIHKLGSAAATFRGDPKRHPAFYPFRRETIRPRHLQKQLLMSFGVRLTDDENVAFVQYLDSRRCGLVQCEIFLKYFWLFGRTHRKLTDQTERSRNQQGEKKRQAELKRHLRRFAYHPPAVMKPFQKQHLLHVLDTFADMTHTYDYETLQIKLKHFDNVPPMTPTVFKDCLYRNFRMKVSAEELVS